MTTQLDDDRLREILESATTIAVVGASTDPAKPAHIIPSRLIEAGFTVIPVNPTTDTLFGQRSYPSLADIPVPVDIVDVFRPSAEAEGIAAQAAAIGASTLWLQLGITSEGARAVAAESAMTFVEDLCLGATATRLGIRKQAE